MTSPTNASIGRTIATLPGQALARFLALPGPTAPLMVAIALAVVFWAIPASYISSGGLSHTDEFYTLDRTTGFARHGDWLSVYSEGAVSFRKPPLQYWMGAVVLENGLDLTPGLRLPSAAFALAGLLATALLAYAMLPGTPWVMPAAVLLLASSDSYWESAISAMLDSGATLFVTLAMACAILALRRPGWWYGAALAVGLGALQKAPIALLAVAMFVLLLGLTSALHPYSFRTIFAQRAFRRSAILALALALSWHAFQLAQHGWIAISTSFGDQMIARFSLGNGTTPGRTPGEVAGLLFDNEYALRGLGMVALAALPRQTGRRELLPLPLIVLTFAGAVILAGGYVSHRYSQLFLPLFSAALAVSILAARFSPRWAMGALLLISVLSHGPVKLLDALNVGQSGRVGDQITALVEFSDSRDPAAWPVFCHWDRDTLFPPGMISYYGTGGQPFTLLFGSGPGALAVLDANPAGTMQGVCSEAEVSALAIRLEGLNFGAQSGLYRIWSANALPRP